MTTENNLTEMEFDFLSTYYEKGFKNICVHKNYFAMRHQQNLARIDFKAMKKYMVVKFDKLQIGVEYDICELLVRNRNTDYNTYSVKELMRLNYENKMCKKEIINLRREFMDEIVSLKNGIINGTI